MHKKIESDLMSLAHKILRIKDKSDVTALYHTAQEVYEKLALLHYINDYTADPLNTKTKEELVATYVEKEVIESEVEKKVEVKKEPISEVVTPSVKEISTPIFEEKNDVVAIEVDKIKGEVESLFVPKEEERIVGFETKKDVSIPEHVSSLENEIESAMAADIATDLFEKADKVPSQKSLNDTLHKNIQVGLNDRIGFVKHLFGNSQEDFNRVLSQLNSFATEKEAKSFVQQFVKPEYDWTNKEDYEERLLSLIERKFI